MHLITEIVWKLVTFVVVCLFTISLPFILLVLAIWHPSHKPECTARFSRPRRGE